MTTPVAERVMKARHVSECPVCLLVIRIGDRIAKCPAGLGFMHLEPCWWTHLARDHQAVAQ